MRVLIVEDDPMSALVLRKTLESMGHDVVATTDGQEAWERVQEDDIRLVISDWMMPRMDGLELCRRIRGQNRRVYPYVIVVTASAPAQGSDRGVAGRRRRPVVEALRPGGAAARIEVARRILTMQEELETRSRELEAVRDELACRNERLAEMAVCDALTGLKNRRHFHEMLDTNFSFAVRQGLPLSVVMIDVDQFKPYNDTFGHPAGDAVLRELAGMFQAHSREHDLIARYGGEEFVLLLPGTDPFGAHLVCERLRSLIEQHRWRLRPITASFGMTTLHSNTRTSAQLVDEADQALYHSKRRGRNRLTHFQDLVATPV